MEECSIPFANKQLLNGENFKVIYIFLKLCSMHRTNGEMLIQENWLHLGKISKSAVFQQWPLFHRQLCLKPLWKFWGGGHYELTEIPSPQASSLALHHLRRGILQVWIITSSPVMQELYASQARSADVWGYQLLTRPNSAPFQAGRLRILGSDYPSQLALWVEVLYHEGQVKKRRMCPLNDNINNK